MNSAAQRPSLTVCASRSRTWKALGLRALHECAGGGVGTVDVAAATLFVAGIAARTKGKVVWCLTRRDLFFPARKSPNCLRTRSPILRKNSRSRG